MECCHASNGPAAAVFARPRRARASVARARPYVGRARRILPTTDAKHFAGCRMFHADDLTDQPDDHTRTDRADRELTGLVAGEQLRMIFAHSTVGTVIATVFALFLASHVAGHVPRALLIGWVALKIAVALPRVVLPHLYRLRGRPAGAAWHGWTVALLALGGAGW